MIKKTNKLGRPASFIFPSNVAAAASDHRILEMWLSDLDMMFRRTSTISQPRLDEGRSAPCWFLPVSITSLSDCLLS